LFIDRGTTKQPPKTTGTIEICKKHTWVLEVNAQNLYFDMGITIEPRTSKRIIRTVRNSTPDRVSDIYRERT
jgi:hypothetical protein